MHGQNHIKFMFITFIILSENKITLRRCFTDLLHI